MNAGGPASTSPPPRPSPSRSTAPRPPPWSPPRCAARARSCTASARPAASGPAPTRRPPQPTRLFDLASVTKPFTALALARLERAGLLRRDERLGDVLPALAGTRSAGVPLDLLAAHRAGLDAHRPLYAPLVEGGAVDPAAALVAAADARRDGLRGRRRRPRASRRCTATSATCSSAPPSPRAAAPTSTS